MSTRYVTPRVANLAKSLGVTADAVTGTGVGGRITPGDVRVAAGLPRNPEPQTPAVAKVVRAAATAVPRRSLVQTFESNFSALDTRGSTAGYGGMRVGGGTVRVDAFAANPLADEMRQALPEVFAAASRVQPPPTLFSDGDVPLFTSAGFDPSDLMQLPWFARHAAARASSGQARDIFDRYGIADEAAVNAAEMAYTLADGPTLYRRRAAAWLTLGANAISGGAR